MTVELREGADTQDSTKSSFIEQRELKSRVLVKGFLKIVVPSQSLAPGAQGRCAERSKTWEDLQVEKGLAYLRLHFSWYSWSWFSLTLNSLTRASRLALRKFWCVSYRKSWLFSSSCRLRSWRQEEYSSSSLSWRVEKRTTMWWQCLPNQKVGHAILRVWLREASGKRLQLG